MRSPENFPPLEPSKAQEVDHKIGSGDLDYNDLFPLISHLAFASPRTVVLSPVVDKPREGKDPAQSLEREMLFNLAAGAMHDVLVNGELPTSPVIKYPRRVLNPTNSHERSLRKAATVAELFLSHKVTVYADCGLDHEMKEALSVAKALDLEVEIKLLGLPEGWTGAPPSKILEKAEAAYAKISPHSGLKLALDQEEWKYIESKLEQGTLENRDVMSVAVLIHDNEHVVVESPFAPVHGKDNARIFGKMDLSINENFAYAAQRNLILAGKMPSASHTEFTHEGILDDTVTHERVLGIAAGLAKTVFFDVSFLYDNRDISSGMEKGAEFAESIGRKVLRERGELDPKYWRGSFQDYVEGDFKRMADSMEVAFELMYPDKHDPELAILGARHLPDEALKRLGLYIGDEVLATLSEILPEPEMNRVIEMRNQALREEREKTISKPAKPFAFDRARLAAGMIVELAVPQKGGER